MPTAFETLASQIPGVKAGAMFGKPTLMVGKKSIGHWQDPNLVLKLPAGPREEALALAGAHLFDAGNGRPMKEWIVIPAAHQAQWKRFAEAAYKYLTSQ